MKRIFATWILATMVFSLALPAIAMKSVIGAEEKPQFLYVVSAMSGKYADGVLDLSGVPGVVYFSDRPLRLAGHMSVEGFVEQWAEKQESLAYDPPNAAFSVLDEASGIVVLEVLSIMAHEDGLRAKVKILDGDMPAEFTLSSLFIDPVQVSYPGVY